MPSLFRFSLVALLLFSLTSCVSSRGRNSGDDDDSNGDDDDASAGDDDDASNAPLFVDLSNLDFTHVFGVNGCPQPIGTVEFTNNTDVEATFQIDSGHELLDARNADDGNVTGGSVPAGASVTFDVVFNCGGCIADGFTATVEASLSTGDKEASDSDDMTATFEDCPEG